MDTTRLLLDDHIRHPLGCGARLAACLYLRSDLFYCAQHTGLVFDDTSHLVPLFIYESCHRFCDFLDPAAFGYQVAASYETKDFGIWHLLSRILVGFHYY